VRGEDDGRDCLWSNTHCLGVLCGGLRYLFNSIMTMSCFYNDLATLLPTLVTVSAYLYLPHSYQITKRDVAERVCIDPSDPCSLSQCGESFASDSSNLTVCTWVSSIAAEPATSPSQRYDAHAPRLSLEELKYR
jgi:hypothetical protein